MTTNEQPFCVDSLKAFLPNAPLLGAAQQKNWLISTKPYPLTHEQLDFLNDLGGVLYRFYRAVEALYRLSLDKDAYKWVQNVLHAGKPESLLTFAHMNRTKKQMPIVIRPDLLVTDEGFALTELDSVPGGIGMTAALMESYQAAGFDRLPTSNGILPAFLKMMHALRPDIADPTIAIIISEESADYRREMEWLVEKLQQLTPHIHLVHPKTIALQENALGFHTSSNTFEPIHIIYRFFELFDLANIPQIELIQYAIKKGLVVCAPPFKPELEEKMALAFLHHPFLTSFWEEHLSPTDLTCLKKIVPETWILDPAPIPAGAAVIPTLHFKDQVFQRFSDLVHATQKQRELVIKPSGFSPLAWGSRGVKIGHDLSQVDWSAALEHALSEFNSSPHILQRFAHPKITKYEYSEADTGIVYASEGRTRICPYYFVTNQIPELVGVLVTTCPKDKKIIHGMQDGVMYPAALDPSM